MEWIEEKHQDIFVQGYKVKKQLFSGRSPFQKVEVVESEGHGRMLFNDGLVMVSERDEFVYHEMIAHLPLCVHPRPKRVLIVGGGDGGTAREVVRHQEVEECVVVEIDEMVVRACKEHLPTCSVGFSHPKVELIIGDGIDFVAKHKDAFDVVLVDSTDPIGPATPLFGMDFYRNLRDCLKEDGIVVSQGESPWYEMEMQKKLMGIKRELFGIVSCYNYSNLTYPGGIWSFTWGSKKYHPIGDQDLARGKALSCRYYNTEVHRQAFIFPTFQWNELRDLCRGMA